jgi:RNA polymerase sigma factor (sigma-70 family)
MRTEDGHFINKCLSGEIEAFGFLVDKYRESIFAFAYSKLCNVDDAEDVTQEVFLKAYKDLRSLRRWDSFATWLYSITNNICKNYLRTQARRIDKKLSANQDSVTYKSISPNSESDDPMIDSLNEALNILPEIYRQVLTLYYISGKNSEEIARFLSISPSAVRQRLSRARTELKEEILAMMSMTFEQRKLPVGFTFRIMEMVKRIKVHPLSQMKGLPWGLSLATGLLVAVLSFNSHFIPLELFGTYGGSSLPVEQKVLNIGEIPVDALKISNIAMLSDLKGNGNGGEPNLQNSFFMAPQGEGEWIKKADMPTAKAGFGTAIANGKIYIIGGAKDAILANVEEYDPMNDKWEIKSSMPQEKWWLSACSVNGKIYTFGGVDNNNNLSSGVNEYDPVLDKWTKKNDMPFGLCKSAFCSFGSNIYAFGGINNGVTSAAVYKFEPAKDSWTKKNDMPTARYYNSACLANGKIYVIGGALWNGNLTLFSTVEEYDPIADTWARKSDMLTPRAGLDVCPVGTNIYAIGGTKDIDNQSMTTVEIYDALTDTWTKGVDMQISRWGFSASLFNGKIYSIGGFNGNFLSNVEEFNIDFISKSIDPSGKLPTTWGQRKQR